MSVESDIPKEKDAKKTFASPSYRKKVKNFADDEDLVKKFLDRANTNKVFFESQAERRTFADKAEKADRMSRCSRVRDTADKQFDDTRSNVASTAIHQRFQSVTSNENSIYFPTGGDMPFTFTPREGSKDYQLEEGQRLALHNNLLAKYSFDVDGTQEKIKDNIFFLNKYGNQVFRSSWSFEQDERTDREPTKNQQGETTGYKWKTKLTTLKNHPSVDGVRWDNIWFDARIDGMQKQNTIIEWDGVDISELWAEKANGLIVNVEKVDTGDKSKGGQQETNELQKRQANAGEGTTVGDVSSQLDRFNCWVKAPIKMDGDKAKWDEDGTVSTWWWGTFIGQLQGTPTCVRLIENPYFHKQNPYKLVHSHRDDKGAYHMGFVDLIESLYEELTTAVNQAIDVKTKMNRASCMTRKGNILNVEHKFGGNELWYTRSAPTADTIRQIEVKDHTGTFIAMYERILDELDAAMNTGKAIIGEALGSRTSASEAKQVFDQAFKTLLDKAAYQAEQLFPWIADMNQSLWKQYADPKLTIAITTDDGIEEVKPAELWGRMNYAVTAIKRFDTDITRHAQQTQMEQVWKDEFVKLAGPKGTTLYLKDMFRERQISDEPSKYFPINKNADAKRVAQSESDNIYFEQVLDNPAIEEDHEMHISTHEDFLSLVGTMRPEDRSPEGESMLKQHVEQHKQMMAEAAGNGQPLPQGEGQGSGAGQEPQVDAGAAPQLQGEAIGDALGGLAGGQV